MLLFSAEVDKRRSETKVAMRNELLEQKFELNVLSSEVDRKRVDSNELGRYEKVEAKQKDEAAKAIRTQLYDEFQLELMALVDVKRVAEVDKMQR